jgi:predicted enzyme related to lactoylglutathione lyase
MATYALFEDLDGLLVGLVLAPTRPVGTAPESAESVPAGDRAESRPVDWFEVLGSDAPRSQRFYTEIFGWQVSPAGPGYAMVDTGTTRGIRGGIGTGDPSRWVTVYASVPDVAAVLARATTLGGSRVHGPVAVDDHTQTGALRDPAGNIFGVYHHGPH